MKFLMKNASPFLCAVLLLNSCKAPRAEPNLIDPDGVTYARCQGAIWIPKETSVPLNDEPVSYEVRFKDAQGVDRAILVEIKHSLFRPDISWAADRLAELIAKGRGSAALLELVDFLWDYGK